MGINTQQVLAMGNPGHRSSLKICQITLQKTFYPYPHTGSQRCSYMMEIKSVEIMSWAKIHALFGIIFGLIYGILFAILGSAIGASFDMPGATTLGLLAIMSSRSSLGSWRLSAELSWRSCTTSLPARSAVLKSSWSRRKPDPGNFLLFSFFSTVCPVPEGRYSGIFMEWLRQDSYCPLPVLKEHAVKKRTRYPVNRLMPARCGEEAR